ncbi:glutathione S-transferase family protein [Futiania mangrovi]|uniref:Glutathione S-transferase family protein n=1 Tax=Futiania mangrovi TaxID=2959716 RepID=A0A9J6PBP2_9PROT|nr:glutathione S-transferase family protein [Futiania mangrovii]MCP1334987.1 glutathione S-transferase family protein [Futiania mangrovii]
MIELYGFHYSPAVREVRVALEVKGLAYSYDPLDPYADRDRLAQLNPSGRVPVLRDGAAAMTNAVDIFAHLERTYPGVPLLPSVSPAREQAAQAHVFANNELLMAMSGRVFFQRVIRQLHLGQPSDEAVVQQALSVEVPSLLQRLEVALPETGFLCGGLSIADISIGASLRAGLLAGVRVDRANYPRLANYLAAVFSIPAFVRVIAEEDTLAPFQQAYQYYGWGLS